MIKNRQGNMVGEFERECARCGVLYPRTTKNVTICQKCNCERVKSTHPKAKMLQRAKNRSKRRDQHCTLTLEDFDIPTHCPILGMPLVIHSGKSGGRPDSPALDRINNSKGYEKGNVVVISHLANMMKSSATPRELHTFANWVLSTVPRED